MHKRKIIISLISTVLILISIKIIQVSRTTIDVIVPVYNSERFLPKCLDSILEQKGDFDIIAVNDGSTDNSLKILEEYAKNNSNIKIINQPNRGVSSARNAGIKNSKAKYITFVDSDDWLEPTAFETILEIIKKDNPDIVLTGFYDVYDHNWVLQTRGENAIKLAPKESKFANRNLDKLELFSPFYGNNAYSDLFYAGGGVRGRFYRREFLINNNILFSENIDIHEDDIFSFRAYLSNPLISVTKNVIYNYLNRIDSISKNINIVERMPKSLKAMQNTKEYRKANRRIQMLIIDNWVGLSIHAIAMLQLKKSPNETIIKIAKDAYDMMQVYNKNELKSCRNYQKIKRFLLKNEINLAL